MKKFNFYKVINTHTYKAFICTNSMFCFKSIAKSFLCDIRWHCSWLCFSEF